MIVLDEGRGWVLFSQEAHAHLAGEMAARLPPEGADASALVAAARLHDNGWREADRDTTVDDAGRPHPFHRVPAEVYEAVWRRGIGRAAAVDPLVGLLVGLHGARFFGTHPDPRVRALHDEERAREDRVLAELGLGGSWRALPRRVQEASDALRFLDVLSLMACGAVGDTASVEVAGTAYGVVRAGDRLTVDPWPFACAAWDVTIAGLRVDRPAGVSAEAFREALAGASPLTRTRTLTAEAVSPDGA